LVGLRKPRLRWFARRALEAGQAKRPRAHQRFGLLVTTLHRHESLVGLRKPRLRWFARRALEAGRAKRPQAHQRLGLLVTTLPIVNAELPHRKRGSRGGAALGAS
jgi:uncharacterized protein (DUF3820 family)